MKNTQDGIRLITRADDGGSTHSANMGIQKVIKSGFVKNVSLMAVGAYIAEAAEMFADREDICFGLHAAINAEWDDLKWGPVLPADRVPSLVTGEGCFYQDPSLFAAHTPPIDEIMAEVQAQLGVLLDNGFSVKYVDFHMLPERYVPGLRESMSAWLAKKGLIDHSYYYWCIPEINRLAVNPGLFEEVLRQLPPGQYFYICHPAVDTEDALRMSNAYASGETVAAMRNADALFASSDETMDLCRRYGVLPIRYDEAEKKEGALQYLESLYRQM